MSLIPIVSTFSEAGRSLTEVSWKGDGKAFVELSRGEVGFDPDSFCLGLGLTRGGAIPVSSPTRSIKTHGPVEVLFSPLDRVLAKIPPLITVAEVERVALEELLPPREGGDISRSRDGSPVYRGSAFFCRFNGGPRSSRTAAVWSGGMASLALSGRERSLSCRGQ